VSRARRHVPSEEFTLTIESLANDARGVARRDGKTVFVDGALPGETVRCRLLQSRNRYDTAIVSEVLVASPDRVEPRCAAAVNCGGCSLQHMNAQAQIHAKQQVLLDDLRHIARTTPETVLQPLTGPAWHYRRKARLGARLVPKKGGILVGFREQRSSYIAEMSRCEILDERFAGLIMPLRDLIGRLTVAHRVPQVEVAAGDDSAVIVLRHLLPLAEADLAQLRRFAADHGVRVLLQPRGPESVIPLDDDDDGMLSYRLPAWGLELRFQPTGFTQVNAEINRRMVGHTIDLLEVQAGETVLDLFCGIGNFTLPLARLGTQVTGIEADPQLVAQARENALANGLAECEFLTADLYAEPLDGSWLHRQWDRILLDPPRTGAIEVVKRLPELAPRRIVYVSCNPATLARDTEVLVHKHGYRLLAAGVMDMFPHTTHVESVAVFVP